MASPNALARGRLPVNMPNERNLSGNLQRNVAHMRAMREAQLEQSRLSLFNNSNSNSNSNSGPGPGPAESVVLVAGPGNAGAPTHVKVNAFKGAKATISANVKRSTGGRRSRRRSRRRY
jgi:hypothetical protein